MLALLASVPFVAATNDNDIPSYRVFATQTIRVTQVDDYSKSASTPVVNGTAGNGTVGNVTTSSKAPSSANSGFTVSPQYAVAGVAAVALLL